MCLLSYVLPISTRVVGTCALLESMDRSLQNWDPAGLVVYIGDRCDWEILDILAQGALVQHHVEMFSYSHSPPPRC